MQIKITVDEIDAAKLLELTGESEAGTAAGAAIREWLQSKGHEPATKHKGRGGKREGAGRPLADKNRLGVTRDDVCDLLSIMPDEPVSRKKLQSHIEWHHGDYFYDIMLQAIEDEYVKIVSFEGTRTRKYQITDKGKQFRYDWYHAD